MVAPLADLARVATLPTMTERTGGRTTRSILIALSVSVVVHSALLASFRQRDPVASQDLVRVHELTVRLRAPIVSAPNKLQTTQNPVVSEDRSTPSEELLYESTAAADTAARPAGRDRVVGRSKNAKPNTPSTLITTLPHERSSTVAIDGCDPREKASLVRRCEEEVISVTPDQFAGRFRQAFEHLNVTDEFRRDMAQVELMLRQQAELDTLVANGVTDTRMIAQQRLRLREEIERLDAKYENNNLSRLVASSGKLAKALTELAIEKLE